MVFIGTATATIGQFAVSPTPSPRPLQNVLNLETNTGAS